MTTPQEPTPSRIVPFRPRRIRARGARALDEAIASPTAASSEAGALEDQLLHIGAIADPEPGQQVQDQVRHLRAVQLGASSGAFYPHTPTEETPFAASRLGISTMEVMLQTPGEYDPDFVRRVTNNARAAGVTIASIHSMSHLHPMLAPYPRRAAEARDLFQDAIEATVALGANVLVWHGPNRREVESDHGWERFIGLAHELARACGDAGVTLGIENVSHGALALVRNVVAFATRLAEVGSQAEVGFVFDPFQAAEAGANPFMMLAAMGNRIVNVHVSDYREHDPGNRHLLPGDGDLPWSALMRAIAGSGYAGPIMIEGPLGTDVAGIGRVRETMDPLIRSVFSFEPDRNRQDNGPDIAPAGVLKGIALFNQGAFYEQHEAIEAEWHAERGPVRSLYQGLLQIGVGFHHALNGNYQGAIALLADGIAKTAAFRPHALGIDIATLVAETQACLDRLRELGPANIAAFDRAGIPRIEFIAR